MSASNLAYAWAALLLRSLARAGVRDVVVSPGSRSTPLALAAHDAADLTSHFVLDERAAAFFALGQARVTGRPTALVCTSGTAPAHYYPAVIEASMSGVPLIAITADRPWELQQTGASQTIDQTRLFGDFARGFFALGAPEPSEGALRSVARTAAQAALRSTHPLPGPVQINAPFRKPLEPVKNPEREPWTAAWEALLNAGPTRSIAPSLALDPSAFEDCARMVARSERGLLVCGPAPAHGDLDAYRREVLTLARGTGFPIFAEATSQVRFGLAGVAKDAAPVIVSSFDALLRSPAFRRRMTPDLIVEIGAPPVSTGYAQLLAEHPRIPRVVVASPGWTDPASTATAILHADLPAFRAALRVHNVEDCVRSAADSAELGSAAPPRTGLRPPSGGRHLAGLPEGRTAAWCAAIAAEDARARAVIESHVPASSASSETPSTDVPLTETPPPFANGVSDLGGAGRAQRSEHGPGVGNPSDGPGITEAQVARAVVEACPAGSTLMIGNSSPVRDVDVYCPASPKPLRVLHQRGAAGIDGLVAGAAGAASVSSGSVTLLLGDLSLTHDLTSLLLARSVDRPLVIVVVNNDGGRIFEQLPIGRVLGDGPTFERVFATPQGVDLRAAAQAFGVAFERAATETELAVFLSRAHAKGGPALIEAVCPAHDGAARLRAIWADVTAITAAPPTENVEAPRTRDTRKEQAS
ncbi:MAG: 2-succinyl-5-enolpyruvyl-6-hydroxy-3-cyclohexene-1-carboxylic-acid synthase [Polyangiaceae bacterium]